MGQLGLANDIHESVSGSGCSTAVVAGWQVDHITNNVTVHLVYPNEGMATDH